MRSVNQYSLTTKYIESKISQELVASKYLNIPIETVNDCIEFNTLIKSPLRKNDHHGSFGFQYNKKGKLKIRDFGGYFFGDIYDLVAYIISYKHGKVINVSNKQDFYLVLQDIAETFRNIIYGEAIDPTNDIDVDKIKNVIRNQKAIIEIVIREFNEKDVDIWRKWGISLQDLNTNFVYPIDQYYINRQFEAKPRYYYSKNDPCYAYYNGVDSKGIHNIKLYFPLRDRATKSKFITNYNGLEGIITLNDEYDYIIVTKSAKDRLSMQAVIGDFLSLRGNSIRIGYINVPAENYLMRQEEYNFLRSKVDDEYKIISFMDFDATGRKCAKEHSETYNMPYIFITNGELGLINYGVKDFAELVEEYSRDTIYNFIEQTINNIENL